MIIDAETGERIDVLPDRTSQTLAAWLREHPGAEYVCRDGSATYGEAIRQTLPEAVQVSDRWHLWSNLCGKVLAEVRSHAAGWATAVNPARPGGQREHTTRERWHKVHDLLGKGVGLLECARRLDVALNTVKRYARMKERESPVRGGAEAEDREGAPCGHAGAQYRVQGAQGAQGDEHDDDADGGEEKSSNFAGEASRRGCLRRCAHGAHDGRGARLVSRACQKARPRMVCAAWTHG